MLNRIQHDGKEINRKAETTSHIPTENALCCHRRMLERHCRMAWLWVIAINLATLALTVAFIRALR